MNSDTTNDLPHIEIDTDPEEIRQKLHSDDALTRVEAKLDGLYTNHLPHISRDIHGLSLDISGIKSQLTEMHFWLKIFFAALLTLLVGPYIATLFSASHIVH